jgi:hypothetical protein
VITVFTLFLIRSQLVLIPSSHPKPLLSTAKTILFPIPHALLLASSILQIDHNARSNSFAGAYALSSLLACVGGIIDVIGVFGIGTMAQRGQVDMVDVGRFGVVLVMAYQAGTMRRVEQVDED